MEVPGTPQAALARQGDGAGALPRRPPSGSRAGVPEPLAGMEPGVGKQAQASAAAPERLIAEHPKAGRLDAEPPGPGDTEPDGAAGGKAARRSPLSLATATDSGPGRPGHSAGRCESAGQNRRSRSAGDGAPGSGQCWRLRALRVCASTETELDRWLQRLAPGLDDPLPGPLALIARRQRFGRGQQGRVWSSPAGGLWLSAALPWPADPAAAAAPGLAVAVGLALELEALGLEVRLKWPNDLLLAANGRPAKLAGLLPRLRLRGGRIRWARIGLGLNGCNPVPPGATNLVRELGAWQARPERLTARVLRGLEWAMAMADQPLAVRQLAEARLLVAPQSWQGLDPGWQPQGLADDGSLVLARGDERQLLRRHFGCPPSPGMR